VLSRRSDLRPWVVYHHLRGSWPPRRSSRVDLESWGRHAPAPVIYINAAYGLEAERLKALDPSHIVFDTTFMKLRWRDPALFSDAEFRKKLCDLPAAKILRPQDEFVDTVAVDRFAVDIGASLILSCGPEHEHMKLYPESSERNIAVRPVLTGYVDEGLLEIARKVRPIAARPIDVGYLAWRATPWLGRHARLKVEIAEATRRSPITTTLKAHISLDPTDVRTGDGWLQFLSRCKAVIGVQGGASIHDPVGHFRDCGVKYLKDHPGANFTDLEQACFPGAEGSLDLKCLSPRHLEAAAMGSCQILIKGDFNGALLAGRDYIPVETDLSDLDQALLQISDKSRLQEIADSARRRILENVELRYSDFVEKVALQCGPYAPASDAQQRPDGALIRHLQRRDRYLTRRVRFEVWLGQRPRLRLFLSGIRKALTKDDVPQPDHSNKTAP
jgi:hypothetical protein